jgi:hypothetical protein
MPVYSFAFVLALSFAGFYYHAGQSETGSGVLWGGLSLVISAAIILLAQGGILATLLGQLGLLVAITLYRVWRDPD